ncbi:1-deoxy-D-xylulose-5-phosphate reductoisomerase [Thermoanaerobacterium thermosaccharolyticum]|jgi:1-deoxy-D-xylulose-5-phosphate reductoisomerase|uniref:1-deoxy-D-xylulose 5-phosphate reductoisomerase n=2 Tax=Thermoanaerobacterium thermosaccharolyticum TaxID=1517 RepID=A0A223I2Q1_THETR|nr:1-deoxy-D-xylulose-5-phosphate reductoisomerase [Thermoanaerobacterium thermosaccharolyticum]AGB19025.1 1-deoxy-D-xylulose 5-phosphate reductoisomerase [Thermoanaerobacterium thermosaccharolyticum M0795]AST59026.1 1-deoxy-d-xylulose 5-phosphate reductoisomerase [Thermoanaerobacterium thermosaccharolyticum]KAA5807741.1 1-deoxy-D-xylulose-5-phosphate reductoisomerase [Thermoanaerobacterium thermosaccharolyticum]MBE0068052.1 1-deoxy-D-xylulose-5-phosphate reductoisomerase [Thermoanaerobacterium
MKNIVILGSTGSIGTQTLDVVRKSNEFRVIGLTCYNNIELMKEQIEEFKPEFVAVKDNDKALSLKKMINTRTEIISGEEGINKVASLPNIQMVVIAIEGIAALIPTIKAIEAGHDIALANKECLVTGGHIIKRLANEKNVNILPVDSEHNAIYQCIQSGKKEFVNRLIITASGGPFRGKTVDELKCVTVEEALKHPNWKMGKKITIDSATLMNKGFEVIEAKWLFDMPIDKIEVVVHKESIIHSMVEFIDGSIIAEMATPDMRIPIQYALNFPNRKYIDGVSYLDVTKIGKLSFEKPDIKTFRCLQLAYDALKEGGTMTTVLNTADEVAVQLFLKKIISFNDIPYIIEKYMNNHKNIINPELNDIIEVDREIREKIKSEYMR